jgi:hypothetical protein
MTNPDPPTLADALRASENAPLLQIGPPAPDAGWIYRDFYPMPQAHWITLIDMLGMENIRVVAANARQLPPAPMCRAQIWISPAAQEAWAAYLKGATQ